MHRLPFSWSGLRSTKETLKPQSSARNTTHKLCSVVLGNDSANFRQPKQKNMFTNNTLLKLRSLQALSDEGRGLNEKCNQQHHAEYLYSLTSSESQSELKRISASLRLVLQRCMVEALQTAQAEFDNTPFAKNFEQVLNGYLDGASSDASLNLTLMLGQAREWLTAEAEKTLPKGKYRVSSSKHGEFTVYATSASKARLAAAAQHFGREIDATNHNLLRDFSYGTREGEEEEEEEEATTTLAE